MDAQTADNLDRRLIELIQAVDALRRSVEAVGGLRDPSEVI